MQPKLLSICFLCALVVFASSCRNNPKGLAIPKEAAFAVHIKTQSLTSKVSWQEIQQNEWFKNLYAQQIDTLGKRLLEDPANSGIDVQADMALFVKQQQQGAYMAFEGSIKSATSFEAFAQKLNKGGRVQKEGDINILSTSLKSLVAWNNDRFIYIGNAASMPGITNRSPQKLDIDEPYTFKTDSLQKFAVQLFDLPQKENLFNDERFAGLLKEKGDIHYWTNAEQYYNSLGGLLSLLKMNVLFEGNAYGSAIDFENGKIAIHSKAWLNKELTALLKKYPPGKVSSDMINRIPSQNVVAVFAMKYPPAAFKDLTTLLGIDGIVNGFFGSEGFSTDEFVKANKGDLLLAVADFGLRKVSFTVQDDDGEPYTITEPAMPDAKVLLATSVNDKPSFDKFFGILQKTIPEYLPEVSSKIHLQLTNDWFVAGNDPEQMNGFLSGGNNHFPFTARLTKHAFGGYINVQQLLKSVSPSITDSSSKTAIDASINMWQDVVITSNGENNGAFTGETEINLVDKNTNSLKQLNKYIDTITRLFYKNQSRYDVQVLPKELPIVASLLNPVPFK